MGILIGLLINTLAVLVSGYIIPGVTINSFWTAVIVSIFLGLLNTFLKPLLVILTLPVTILTLGLFTLIINAFIVLLVSRLVPGFEVESILSAILFSIVLTLVSGFFHSFK